MKNSFAFIGWKGWADFFKLMHGKTNTQTLAQLRNEVLPLHRSIQKLVRVKCERLATRELKRMEFSFYFKQSKEIDVAQDLRYFLNTMYLIRDKLQNDEYPPFPRRLPVLESGYDEKDDYGYRKWMMNVRRNDVILEPGQDPVRQPFLEFKQDYAGSMDSPDYKYNLPEGTEYDEEKEIFGN